MVNWTKIKGGCQSYTKAASRESWSDFTLACDFRAVFKKYFSKTPKLGINKSVPFANPFSVEAQGFFTQPSGVAIFTFANKSPEIIHNTLAMILTWVWVTCISGSLTLSP